MALDYRKYVRLQLVNKYKTRAQKYLSPLEIQSDVSVLGNIKNIYYRFFKEPTLHSGATELEELAALKQVLKGKLKHLVNDPRPYDTLKSEITATENELYSVNAGILQEIAGEATLNTIKQQLTISLAADNTLKIEFNNKDITTALDKLTLSYIHSNINPLLTGDNVLQFNNLSHDIQNQILNALFFINKNISISTRIRQLRVAQDDAAAQNTHDQEAKLETFHKAAGFNKAYDRYLISRLGKFIAGDYAFSQMTSLAFLCIVILIAISTLVFTTLVLTNPMVWVFFGIGGAITAWWVQATLRNNWWSFRDNTANMLIEIWNMLVNPDDVPYTRWQKFFVGIAFGICLISGFIAGYFTHMMTIKGVVLLFGTAGSILPWFTLAIAIVAGIAITLVFFKYFKQTVLNASTFKDIKFFLTVLFTSDDAKIKNLKTTICDELQQRYKHYYTGEALAKKIENQFDDSILGVILNYNARANSKGFVIFRGVIMLVVAFGFMPVIVGGIIYGQLASFTPLAELIENTFKFSETAAEWISKVLCVFAGIAYIPLFTKATVKCGADLTYAVTKSKSENEDGTPKKEPTLTELADFQQVRLGNASDNGAQTLFGYVEVEGGKEIDGEVDFSDALENVLADSSKIGIGATFTVAATMASFVTTSMPGERVNFDRKLMTAAKKYTHALENANRKTVTISVKKKGGDGSENIQIFQKDSTKSNIRDERLEKLINDNAVTFSKISANLQQSREEAIHLELEDPNAGTITFQTTSYYKRQVFNNKIISQPYVDADDIKKVLEYYQDHKNESNIEHQLTAYIAENKISGVRIGKTFYTPPLNVQA